MKYFKYEEVDDNGNDMILLTAKKEDLYLLAKECINIREENAAVYKKLGAVREAEVMKKRDFWLCTPPLLFDEICEEIKELLIDNCVFDEDKVKFALNLFSREWFTTGLRCGLQIYLTYPEEEEEVEVEAE